jgi:hypothetical protein
MSSRNTVLHVISFIWFLVYLTMLFKLQRLYSVEWDDQALGMSKVSDGSAYELYEDSIPTFARRNWVKRLKT